MLYLPVLCRRQMIESLYCCRPLKRIPPHDDDDAARIIVTKKRAPFPFSQCRALQLTEASLLLCIRQTKIKWSASILFINTRRQQQQQRRWPPRSIIKTIWVYVYELQKEIRVGGIERRKTSDSCRLMVQKRNNCLGDYLIARVMCVTLELLLFLYDLKAPLPFRLA